MDCDFSKTTLKFSKLVIISAKSRYTQRRGHIKRRRKEKGGRENLTLN
jgi:hypothetical protein